jgi:hypothetical protein
VALVIPRSIISNIMSAVITVCNSSSEVVHVFSSALRLSRSVSGGGGQLRV